MCDERAAALGSLTMTTSLEKSQIHVVFSKAIKRLQGSDKQLPQILRLKELVSKGIAVHHGGLLPILKEVVEILFARGLVKVLFATETFAIGVNMPAKTVIYNGLRKHDGVRFRDLLPGEYTQMAGRAGRRGLDTVGTVIVFMGSGKEPPPLDVLVGMMTGSATKLSSQFRLSYTMILTLLRTSELSVSDMIKRSFSEFGTQRLIGGKDISGMISKGETRLQQLKAALLQEDPITCAELEEYEHIIYSLQTQFGELALSLFNESFGKKPASLLFTAGRVVLANVPNKGICMATIKDTFSSSQVKLFCDNEEYSVALSQVVFYSNSTDPSTLLQTPVDPVKDFKVRDIDFVNRWRAACALARNLADNYIHNNPRNSELFLIQRRISDMSRKLNSARRAISDESLALFPDFKARLDLLSQLGYISKVDQIVQLKGRAASEINTCDELILTELIFDDIFGPLLPEECAAICSALVLQSRQCKDIPSLTPTLEIAKDKMLEIAARLEYMQQRLGVEIDPDYLATSVNIGLMEAVYQWARGMPFKNICSLTSLEEGSIVRCITRIEETCREVRNIAQIVGNAELFKKMETASQLIKRDIIFASSLYLNN